MTLDQARIGQTLTIRRLTGQGPLRRRLLDLGLLPGTKVTVTGSAPLGDPMELTLRGSLLTLRRADGMIVEVTQDNGKGRDRP